MPQSPERPVISQPLLDAWLEGADENEEIEKISPLVDAAAVLSSFDPNLIAPTDRSKSDVEAVNSLLKFSKPLMGATGPRALWQLDDAQRQIAVGRMGSRQVLLNARTANPTSATDAVQRGIDLLLKADKQPPLDDLPLTDLLGLERASRWLANVDGMHLPAQTDLSRRIERERVLQPMRKLVSNGFVGRDKELAKLDAYVGATKENHPRHDMTTRPPLFLFGAGGVGKSTLLAKFILRHADPSAAMPLPFVYLDFDRACLDPRLPDTLLAEAIRQIEAQFPELLVPTLSAQSHERFSSRESVEVSKGNQFSRSSRLLNSFLHLLNTLASINARPLLFVLDTFEEAQVHGESAVITVWSLLSQLLDHVEQLRIVVAGRAPLSKYVAHEPLLLDSLDEAAGTAFLVRQTREMEGGPLSAELAHDIFALLGVQREDGNVGAVPLSLALGARIVLREGLAALQETMSRRGVFAQITAEQQQGLLNTRVLQHLHSDDPNLEKIADPGLLLRRIDPDVIRHVLAQPCGIALESEEDAQLLYETLRAEVGLLDSFKEPGALWHLPSVRRVMLPALRRRSGSELARAIHDNAVLHYAKLDGDVARGEELYHRLCRGDDKAVLESRWPPGHANLETALRSAYEELDGQAKLWLADKLGLEVDEALRQSASLSDWERQAELRAQSFMGGGLVSEALAALREREARSLASALPIMEADALLLLHRPVEARTVVIAALERGSTSGREDINAALLTRLVTIEERLERLRDALQAATEARLAARTAGDQISEAGAGAAILRLTGKLNLERRPAERQLRQQLVSAVGDAALRLQLRKRPAVLRELAAELAHDAPDLLADALEVVGIERDELSDGALLRISSILRGVVDKSSGLLLNTLDKLTNRDSGVSTAGVGRELAAVLRRHKDNRELVDALTHTMTRAVDRSVGQVVGPDTGTTISIDDQEARRLAIAMAGAFDRGGLEEFTYLNLNVALATIVPPTLPMVHQTTSLLDYCQRQGITQRLLDGLVRRVTDGQGKRRDLHTLATSLLRGRSTLTTPATIDLSDLNTLQLRVLDTAIVESFTRDDLGLVMLGLGHDLNRIVAPEEPLSRQVSLLTRVSQTEGWTDRLVDALRSARPKNRRLHTLVADLALLNFEGDRRLEGRTLERTLASARGLSFEAWTKRLSQLANQVCRIEDPRTGRVGTGFLVGPDLVLTTFHVMQRYVDRRLDVSQVACVFAHIPPTAEGSHDRRRVQLAHSGWLVSSAPYGVADTADGLPLPTELDYTLLRLALPVGDEQTVRGPRGWITLANNGKPLGHGDVVFVLTHLDNLSPKVSVGSVLRTNANGTRMQYDIDTQPGSSGSPCFDVMLNLVALHQEYPGGSPAYNQGVPTQRIAAHISSPHAK